jgi:hypothetical protein
VEKARLRNQAFGSLSAASCQAHTAPAWRSTYLVARPQKEERDEVRSPLMELRPLAGTARVY